MFFSVKKAIKIAGKNYVPCICYEVTKYLETTVLKLADEGRATVYDKRVFFQNGKLIEEKPVVKENLTAEKPRKTKKSKTVITEASVDDKDETEGF